MTYLRKRPRAYTCVEDFRTAGSRPARQRPSATKSAADLVLDLGRVIQRRGDRVADEFAVAAAEAVRGGLDGPLGHPQRFGNGPVGFDLGARGQDRLEVGEQRALSLGLVLAAKLRQHLLEQGEDPGALVESLRRERIGRLGAVAALGLDGVDRDRDLAAAPLLRPSWSRQSAR